MDVIALAGIEAFGRHGVFPEERENGQRFVVDVSLEVDLAPAARTDQLADTIDYGALAEAVVAVVAGEPVNLIETLAERIAARCLAEPGVTAVAVTVHKPEAPMPAPVRDAAVTVRRVRA